METILEYICRQFSASPVEEIQILGNGLINDTFLVKTGTESFVLQKINQQVFPDPRLIMENLILLNQALNQRKNADDATLKIPAVLKTSEQSYLYQDEHHVYWRAIEYIDNTYSKETIINLHEATQVGFALGQFHNSLSDVNVATYHDTLPGFHITPQYYDQYLETEKQNYGPDNSAKIQFCKSFIYSFREKKDVLEIAKHHGFLLERIIHGDPKLNNFLFDKQSNNIISLIDLDTVKPGLVHYDIADCLRSCCHDVESNSFDMAIGEALLNSYLQQAHCFFTDHDYDYLYPAIQLIPFELGLRFFTDYLAGNHYFKVDLPDQNLTRALAQFKLCENITQQEGAIRRLINSERAQNLSKKQ